MGGEAESMMVLQIPEHVTSQVVLFLFLRTLRLVVGKGAAWHRVFLRHASPSKIRSESLRPPVA